MDDKTISEMILEDRGEFYGCSRDTFFRKGTTFKYRESMDKWDCLYLTKIFDHHFITAGKHAIELLSSGKNTLDAEVDRDFLQSKINNLEEDCGYPHFFYRKDSVTKQPLPDGYQIRKADPSDHPLLQEFLDRCTEEDIEDALIDLEDPDEEIRLVYHGETSVGYAGYRKWGKNMGDVGILVQSEHRKKGLGIAAVAEATRACLENGRLPFYRTSTDNIGSASIAKNLGYTWEWQTTEYVWK